MHAQQPSALSLFSGAGGFDLGMRKAGFNLLACVERDPFCCATLRANFEREQVATRVIENDIRNIDPEQLRVALGLQVGELDLLFGGPPCQAFSQIGKRLALQDERGMLFFEMARFAQVFRPRVMLIEQVKGLLNAPDHQGVMGGVMQLMLNALAALGYQVQWQVLLAADYGVPQLRQRVFIVALREKMPFAFPEPTHRPPSQNQSLFGLPRYQTVGDVLADLPPPHTKEAYSGSDSHVDITPAGDRFRIHGVPEGDHLAAQQHLPAAQRCTLTKKDTTKFRRMSRYSPALTLRCGEVFFHPSEDRYLTVREYMRIHTYPDNYILKGAIRGRSGRVRDLDQYRQIANSVPPRLAEHLGRAILTSLQAVPVQEMLV
ncbi:MAG: DNA cytosine methyltransferase [Candidatus Viridilinea halotolerans]|uniref:Cytosine-specific methyltransferase n=1 Tax=Candidatus Viridilinea halotolerans TaxID=2491704 RepID=A0A426U125_9CHLR|nr:MAG: DNA cytosine methyltransferase [Candidatus Viridilinea halotolerans]